MKNVPKLLPKDTLKQGYPKINMVIDEVNYFQKQIDQIVVEGDSSVEAAQARVNESGQTFPTLKSRLDASDTSLAQTAQQTELEQRTTFLRPKSVEFNHQIIKRPLVSFIDDDGRSPAYTSLKPLFDSKGVVGSVAIVTKYMNGTSSTYMRKSEVQQLANAGWEILSHSVTHTHLDTMTEEDIKFEIEESARILREDFDVKGFVYPYGSMTKPIIHKYTKENYDHAYGGFGRANVPVRSTAIVRIVLGDNRDLTFDYFKNHIDQSQKDNAWLVICTHCGTWTEAEYQMASNVIDYIKSKGIEIVTPSEGYKVFGNAIENYNDETGQFYVVPKVGGVYSDNIKNSISIDYSTGYTVNTPISEFPKDKLTVTTIYNSDSAAFPTSSGVLETFRGQDDQFSYQIWRDINQRDFYIRRFSGSSWSTFNRFRRRDLVTLTHTVTARNINAQSTSDVLITVPQLGHGYEISAYPHGSLQSGIVYNVMYANSTTVRLRLTNITSNPIEMPDRDWTVLVGNTPV
ncbi:polysaccharide deacetylase family protein [Anaerobacillus sp. CMMVII]|uniref:polysaccharide deacetylase family protein n=1 Tax=Anaerobacillus sp. CMMVII TaxID=2755588 RepID=UPI0021B75EAD|nr:polysaccharide deacetylase family protein [Anaerobacillus sp. CMMVII]MCT8138649.1 polysaccharide deacetylase family protein [Anaerobacillus sp. CMMVII]